MKLLRGLLAVAALAALWAVPAFAMEHCDHAQTEMEGHEAHAAAHDSAPEHHLFAVNAATEMVPTGNSGEESGACQHNAGEACKCRSRMALSCGLEGCCIKSDGPLGAGLNDRPPTNDDHALSIQTALPGMHGRTVAAIHWLRTPPRNLCGPDPRPPSA